MDVAFQNEQNRLAHYSGPTPESLEKELRSSA